MRLKNRICKQLINNAKQYIAGFSLPEQSPCVYEYFGKCQFFGIPGLPHSQVRACTVFLFFSVFCFFPVIPRVFQQCEISGMVRGMFSGVPFPNPRCRCIVGVPQSEFQSGDAMLPNPDTAPAVGYQIQARGSGPQRFQRTRQTG